MLSKFELNLRNVLLDDLKISNDLYPSIKYFRQSIHSVQVWLMCLKSYHDENYYLNLEKIYQEANKLKLISRPSIVKFIRDAGMNNYIYLTRNKIDKRSRLIFATDQTVLEYQKWSKNFLNLD